MPERLKLASQAYETGDIAQAESICRAMLRDDPNNALALHFLGVIAHQTQHNKTAEELLTRAAALDPLNSDCHLNLGNVLLALGRADEAMAKYRAAIELDPRSCSAHANLAAVFMGKGQAGEAIGACRKALEIEPDRVDAHYNMAVAHMLLEQIDQALLHTEKALQLRPDYHDALLLLGSIHQRRGHTVEALKVFRAAVAAVPGSAASQSNLATALHELGALGEALPHHRTAVELDPRHPDVQVNLANTLVDMGQCGEARNLCQGVIGTHPDHVGAHINLGRALAELGAVDEAEASFKRALELSPGDARPLVNLGTLLLDQNRIAAARAVLEEAVEAAPGYVPALANLAKLHQNRGDIPKAIEIGNRAIEANPARAEVHSNLLFARQYHMAENEESLATGAREWAKRHTKHPTPPADATTTAGLDPGKRLRLGYVSADLRRHSVGHFMAGIFSCHDTENFEIFCYHNSLMEDATSRWFRERADVWRPIFALSDDQAAAQIAKDGIHILVDLSGHTAGNRLPMFARKPAPVQVTYLGYPGTTGLDAIDYRISDEYADQESAESSSAEKIIRLPRGFHCYTPPQDAPDVSALPATANSYVTFGSFNNVSKLSPAVIEAWSRILAGAPSARLVLKHRVFACAETRDDFMNRFAQHGIAAERLELWPGVTNLAEHMSAYGKIDIALDSFPYNGTATTCEALWMGVPVVSIAAERHASRVGMSLMNTLGMPEMVAEDATAYVELAVSLSRDIKGLAGLRTGLRERLRASPLMDAKGFTKKLEKAYRAMWREYCDGAST